MSDRCTVWVTIKHSDIDLHKDSADFREFMKNAAEQSGNEQWAEFMFEDVRYPDDHVQVLETLQIPFKMLNSAGEYPEALTYYRGPGTRTCQALLDGDIICRMDRRTGNPDPESMKNIYDFLKEERVFEEYLKESNVKTVTVQIGNSDDKLTQEEWSRFVQCVQIAIKTYGSQMHFRGGAAADAPWQNYAWVFAILPHRLRALRTELTNIGIKFRQESVALTIGKTEFI